MRKLGNLYYGKLIGRLVSARNNVQGFFIVEKFIQTLGWWRYQEIQSHLNLTTELYHRKKR